MERRATYLFSAPETLESRFSTPRNPSRKSLPHAEYMVYGVDKRGKSCSTAWVIISAVGLFPRTSTTAATPEMTDVRITWMLFRPVSRREPDVGPRSISLIKSLAVPATTSESSFSSPASTSAFSISFICDSFMSGLFIFCKDVTKLVGTDTSVGIRIHHNGRSQTTRPKATHGFKGKTSIRRCLSRCEVEIIGQTFQDILAPPHVTRRPKANLDKTPSLGYH